MRREGKGGSVVNIGSINCRGGQSNLPVYSCTKAALMAMTKHAAWAMRRERIRSNYLVGSLLSHYRLTLALTGSWMDVYTS